MTISKKGLDLIKGFEGFRSRPYLDQAGVPTIGYGTTHYVGGRAVTMEDHEIPESVATEIMRDEINNHYAPAVDAYVQVPINQNQFDSLVSFAYNVGVQALRKSTLLHKINSQASNHDIANEFMKWVYVNHEVSPGLIRRRMAEDELYFS